MAIALPQGLQVDPAGNVTIHDHADLDLIEEFADANALPPRADRNIREALRVERTGRAADQAERERQRVADNDQFWEARQAGLLDELEANTVRLATAVAVVRRPHDHGVSLDSAVALYENALEGSGRYLRECEGRMDAVRALGLSPGVEARLIDRLREARKEVMAARAALDGLEARVDGYGRRAEVLRRAETDGTERVKDTFPALRGHRDH